MACLSDQKVRLCRLTTMQVDGLGFGMISDDDQMWTVDREGQKHQVWTRLDRAADPYFNHLLLALHGGNTVSVGRAAARHLHLFCEHVPEPLVWMLASRSATAPSLNPALFRPFLTPHGSSACSQAPPPPDPGPLACLPAILPQHPCLTRLRSIPAAWLRSIPAAGLLAVLCAWTKHTGQQRLYPHRSPTAPLLVRPPHPLVHSSGPARVTQVTPAPASPHLTPCRP
eukprot:287978-Chlamydomonas_euryale.AAC.1